MNEELIYPEDTNYHEIPKYECTNDFSDNWYVYDCESFSNFWSMVLLKINDGSYQEFRLHLDDPKDVQRDNFNRLKKTFDEFVDNTDVIMCSFNGISYDYPLIHFLLNKNIESPEEWILAAKEKNDQLINTPFQDRFSNIIWEKDRLIKQCDTRLIHHMDNMAKMTSLKALEFEMRLESIDETPVDFNLPCPIKKADEVMHYNLIDVYATAEFAKQSVSELKFRQSLKHQHPDYDWMNFSDSKIGSTIMQIQYQEKNGWKAIYETDSRGKLIRDEDGRTIKKQSPRDKIDLGELIFDYVKFDKPEFNAILDWFKNKTITETKGSLTQLKPKEIPDSLIKYMEHKDGKILTKKQDGVIGVPNLHCLVDGVKYVFGTGGLHASVHKEKFESADDIMIVDIDVQSYYPNLSIKNRVYPEHLGEPFCDDYEEVFNERLKHKKGSVLNLGYKLGLNSVYGNSNNKYSIFFDPIFTMTITINGQLLLCMLAEKLEKIDGYKLIQANTDGITILAKRTAKDEINKICKAWCKLTKLKLEFNKYSKMLIHNVNNYIAVEEESGDVKRKGMLCARIRRDCDEGKRELGWHQDPSNLISKKAAEKYMLEGIPIEQTLTQHEDLMDFTKRAKVNRSSLLVLGDPKTYEVLWDFEQEKLVCKGGNEQQKLSRYYVSHDGDVLVKYMPPTKKKLSLEHKKRLFKIQNPDFTLKKCGEMARDESQWSDMKYKFEYLHECLQQKTAPNLNKFEQKYHEYIINNLTSSPRGTIIEAGDGKEPWRVKIMNRTTEIDADDICYEYYQKEADKLVIE